MKIKCFVKCKAFFSDSIGDSCSYVQESLEEWTGQQFPNTDGIIFVGAVGIAVRAIAGFVKTKKEDPAVVVVDEKGSFVIPILAGHIGGANELAALVAEKLAATAVITTATDINQKWAVDVFAKKHQLAISDMTKAKEISAKVLEGKNLHIYIEEGQMISDEFPEEVQFSDRSQADVVVGIRRNAEESRMEGCPDEKEDQRLYLVPPLVLGVGCRKEVAPEKFEQVVLRFLEMHRIPIEAVKKIASIDLKAREKAICDFAEKYQLPFDTFSAEQLQAVPGTFTTSEFVKSVTGVDSVCERSAVCAAGKRGDKEPVPLEARKYAKDQVTVAAAYVVNSANDVAGEMEVQTGENTELVWKNQKQMRTGFTTGSCATAASKAAARMLLSGEEVRQIRIMTPAGRELFLDVEKIHREGEKVSCAIQKDSGDDPDVTNGIYIHATVEKTMSPGIIIDGGVGVGRVTKPGLAQKIGEAAINKVPRQMITAELSGEIEKHHFPGGLKTTIWIPEGERLANKTFNPRLGIMNGISVLGTSGIVEPMSEKALIETIQLEMNMIHESGKEYCYLVPGNYGKDFLIEKMGYDESLAVKCSNYVGETLDYALQLEMKGLLMIGHAGKFVKLAAGVMNTHSRSADARMEVLASHAACCGADRELVQFIMGCVTTEDALGKLKEEGFLETVMKEIMEKIMDHLNHRCQKKIEIGVMIFTQELGVIGQTDNVLELRNKIQGEG